MWRIYSMSKPITSVAAMMLWEEGLFELTDEVARLLPSFADLSVYEKGSTSKPYVVPATEPIRIWHCSSHTSGLTYGFLNTSVVDGIYRAAGYEWGSPSGPIWPLRAMRGRAAVVVPPGSAWGYSVATDVLGRIVEVVSGQSLDEFLEERIFAPLGMTDTAFWTDDAERLARLYTPDPVKGLAVPLDQFGRGALRKPSLMSGGGGLISTAADYARFTGCWPAGGSSTECACWEPHGGPDDAQRLPAWPDLGALSTGGFAETTFEGIGFGLGFAVVQDPVPSRTLSSAGEFFWGGAASTAFWVDPVEDVTAHFFTQLLPSSTHPIRPQLRQLVYSALVD